MEHIEKTIALLQESGAMLEGHFLLSSGRHSDRYFQCAKLLQYPERAAAALAGVVEAIKEAGAAPDAVVGPALGGIIVAYELGRQLGIPGFFTERDDAGLMGLRRGFTVPQGSRILLAEDVITTTSSALETARVLQALGAQMVGLACLVDRRGPGVSLPWPLYAASRIPAVSWEAETCALCKQGLPLVKPGSRKGI
ncbi:MAG: orotate phosphoribosyltransferase [Treponema sp.]|jgi:orotate phosphoribosyltransferase|nr:orotate phosphoribosyltransferase [Treponema sp.]